MRICVCGVFRASLVHSILFFYSEIQDQQLPESGRLADQQAFLSVPITEAIVIAQLLPGCWGLDSVLHAVWQAFLSTEPSPWPLKIDFIISQATATSVILVT